MAHLTGKSRFGTSFRKNGDAGNIGDILEKKIPEEKLREFDKVLLRTEAIIACSIHFYFYLALRMF
jgi:hypothetical protein